MTIRRVVFSMLMIMATASASQHVRADDHGKPPEKATEKPDEKAAHPPMPADVTSEQHVSLPGRGAEIPCDGGQPADAECQGRA